MFLKEKISREKMRQPSKSFITKRKMSVNLWLCRKIVSVSPRDPSSAAFKVRRSRQDLQQQNISHGKIKLFRNCS